MKYVSRALMLMALLFITISVIVIFSFQSPKKLESVSDEFSMFGLTVINPLVEKNTFTSIHVSEGKFSSSSEGNHYDFTGYYALPGFVNTHIHLSPSETPFHLTDYMSLLYLSHGVTSVRVAGDGVDSVMNTFKYLEEGDYPSPRIYATSPLVEGIYNQGMPDAIYLKSSEGVHDLIDLVKEHNLVGIKSHDHLSSLLTTSIVDEAKENDIPVIGHISYGLTLENSDVPNVQHLMGIVKPEALEDNHSMMYRFVDWRSVDNTRMAEAVEVSIDKGLTHTPTLGNTDNFLMYKDLENTLSLDHITLLPKMYTHEFWHPEYGVPMYRNLSEDDYEVMITSRPKKIEQVRLLHEAGVPLQVGTDDLQPFAVPGYSYWHEMRLFEEAGIPIEDIFAYATWKVGPEFDSDQIGKTQVGAPADLVIYKENPLNNLDNLTTIAAVVVDGNLYMKDDIDRAIKRYQEFYDRPVIDIVSRFLARNIMKSLPEEVIGEEVH